MLTGCAVADMIHEHDSHNLTQKANLPPNYGRHNLTSQEARQQGLTQHERLCS